MTCSLGCVGNIFFPMQVDLSLPQVWVRFWHLGVKVGNLRRKKNQQYYLRWKTIDLNINNYIYTVISHLWTFFFFCGPGQGYNKTNNNYYLFMCHGAKAPLTYTHQKKKIQEF